MKAEKDNAYGLNWRGAITLTVVVAVLVVAAMIHKAIHTEAVTIELNGSVSLSANRLGRVINLYTYNGFDRDMSYLNYKDMSYPEVIEQILTKETENGYLEKGARISAEIWVEKSSVNDRYKIIERNVKDCADKASMRAQCSQMDAGIVRTAESYGISVGKYRMICEMQKMDHSVSLDEYKDYSTDMLRRIYDLMKGGISKDMAEDSSGAQRNSFTYIINRILFESSKGDQAE